jgi:hypothetical protein
VRDRRSRSEYRILADHVVVACGLALEPFISRFYDFKISHQAAGISLRSFCVNGNGHVTAEYHRSLGIRGVNGHSYLSASSGQSNLAIVATITEDHHADPKGYVRETARSSTPPQAGTRSAGNSVTCCPERCARPGSGPATPRPGRGGPGARAGRTVL